MVREMPIVNALVVKEGKLLIIRRRDKNPMWDRKWQFPGGKIEETEDPMQALCRELQEETGICVQAPTFLGLVPHDWHMQDGSVLRVLIHCFLCETDRDVISLEDGKADQHEWIDPQSASDFDLLAGNLEIVRKFFHSG